MTNNFQFILDALEVGLEIAEDDDPWFIGVDNLCRVDTIRF